MNPGISSAGYQLIQLQLLERQRQQQLEQQIHALASRGIVGPNSAAAGLAPFPRSHQVLQLPSLQQAHFQTLAATNSSFRQELAFANLNQEQQYLLLLGQQQQQQLRDRQYFDQQTSQSQLSNYMHDQIVASIAASSVPLLRQPDRPMAERSPSIQDTDWMNNRNELSSIVNPSIFRNTFLPALQQPLSERLFPIPQHHQSLNFARSAELSQLLLANQTTERIVNQVQQVAHGSVSLGEQPGGRNDVQGRATQSVESWGQNQELTVGSLFLPAVLARAEDVEKLSPQQVLLRKQIEAFQATSDDLSTHTRGRNKPIGFNQVGIRCRHCAHLHVVKRQKGSTYFPATILGIYQASQNMSATHIQSGLCSEMPVELKQQFETLQNLKIASSGAGRPYWAESAKKLGLVDTEDGIQFIRSLRPGARVLLDSENKTNEM